MHDMSEMTIKRIINNHLDLKPGKVGYVITQPTLVKGLWSCLTQYGVAYTRENHHILVEAVEDILMDGADVEYEWTEQQYMTFVVFNPNLIA
jgi:hypothetical protein